MIINWDHAFVGAITSIVVILSYKFLTRHDRKLNSVEESELRDFVNILFEAYRIAAYEAIDSRKVSDTMKNVMKHVVDDRLIFVYGMRFATFMKHIHCD